MANQPIVVIKKITHGKHGHHGGAWKVAYTDFVTAMMAFFLVMWLVSQNPETRRSVAQSFATREHSIRAEPACFLELTAERSVAG